MKILTKLQPEFSWFQCDVMNENYKSCGDDSIAMLPRVENDEIIIRDYEQFSFIETIQNFHSFDNYVGKVNKKIIRRLTI